MKTTFIVIMGALLGVSCRAHDVIPCGKERCDVKTHYCEIYLSDVLQPPTDYECKPLPPACLPNAAHPPTCDCFPKNTPCLSFCGPLPTEGAEGFHLTCQGKKKPATLERR